MMETGSGLPLESGGTACRGDPQDMHLLPPDLGVSSASKSKGGHTASLWLCFSLQLYGRSKKSLGQELPWWPVIKNPR